MYLGIDVVVLFRPNNMNCMSNINFSIIVQVVLLPSHNINNFFVLNVSVSTSRESGA